LAAPEGQISEQNVQEFTLASRLVAGNFWRKCPEKSAPAIELAVVRLSDKISICLVFRLGGSKCPEKECLPPILSKQLSAGIC
jgi:hypothetical protein